MPSSAAPDSIIAGAILAGGLARRMGGGDKPLAMVGGRSLLDHVIERLSPQVGPLLLNANGAPDRFARFALEVRADLMEGHGGPLVGILTALEWAAERGAPWLLSVAGDTSLFPTDLGERLLAALIADGADVAVAASGGRLHPVFALWPVRLAPELRHALVHLRMHRMHDVLGRLRVARVDWPNLPHDPFFNVNTPDDLARLEAMLAAGIPAENGQPAQTGLPPRRA